MIKSIRRMYVRQTLETDFIDMAIGNLDGSINTVPIKKSSKVLKKDGTSMEGTEKLSVFVPLRILKEKVWLIII